MRNKSVGVGVANTNSIAKDVIKSIMVMMMSEKRFIVESVMIDCLCEDEPRIAKVITDTDENYSYEDLYEVAELLNEQQATIERLERKLELKTEEVGYLNRMMVKWGMVKDE